MFHLLNGLPSDQFKFTDFGNNMGTQWISSSFSICFQAIFCWLGDVEEIVRSWKESVGGKKIIHAGCVRSIF